MKTLGKKLLFTVFIFLINAFLVLVVLFLVNTIKLHNRFKTEPVAQAQVFAYSNRYAKTGKGKVEFRSDLQFKTPEGQTIYLHDVALSPNEKSVLEQGNAISRDYLQNEPHIIRPFGTSKVNILMAWLLGGGVIFNFAYLIYWWRKNR